MPTMAAEAEPEPDARSIEANARTVEARSVGVARIVVVVAVGAIAPEASIMRTEAMMPEARPAVHLVDSVDISNRALHGLCARKPDSAGGLSKKPGRRQDGGARQDAKGFLH